MDKGGSEARAIAACPPGGERRLTPGEIGLVRLVFGSAIDCASVRIRRRKWFPLQPRETLMAPWGHIHIHPAGTAYRDDFAAASISLQGLFIHEMTHVWQTQTHGWWYLPLVRPFSRRYDYVLTPGKPLSAYGIEQQAEIVRHAFLIDRGTEPEVSRDRAAYAALTRFEQPLKR